MPAFELPGDVEELPEWSAFAGVTSCKAMPISTQTATAEPAAQPESGAAGSDASQASDRQPLRLSDLPDAEAVAGMPPERQWRRVHAAAVASGLDAYIDPGSGYQVWTRLYLKRKGPCCGNACRHCPYGHENVPKVAQIGVVEEGV